MDVAEVAPDGTGESRRQRKKLGFASSSAAQRSGVGAVLTGPGTSHQGEAEEAADAANRVREALEAPFLAARSATAATAAAANSELERARAEEEAAAAIADAVIVAEEEHAAADAAAARNRVELRSWLDKERTQTRTAAGAEELGEGGLPLSVREQSRARRRQEAAAGSGAGAEGAGKQRRAAKAPGEAGKQQAAAASAAAAAGEAFDYNTARSLLLPMGGGVALLQSAVDEHTKEESSMDNRAPKKRRVEPGRGAGAAAGAAGAKKKERWQFDGRPNFAAEPFKAGPRSKAFPRSGNKSLTFTGPG